MRTCEIDGCDRKYNGNGFCQKHYDADRYAANPEKFAEYQRKYYAANNERVNAQGRERYAANPEKYNARNRKYREANKDEINARRRKRREANKDEINARRRKAHAANPEKAAEYRRKVNATRDIEDVVYVISQPGQDAVKIGFTDCLERRLASIQPHFREAIIVYHTEPGGLVEEQAYHAALKDHLIHHELYEEEGVLNYLFTGHWMKNENRRPR